ncbi:hypothetical protein C8Q73DRAFT_704162 [Cubamyces lactineus]|nr:hypothetical protein C8Q73DRAFT_704162 [Cubamyces lactineus]
MSKYHQPHRPLARSIPPVLPSPLPIDSDPTLPIHRIQISITQDVRHALVHIFPPRCTPPSTHNPCPFPHLALSQHLPSFRLCTLAVALSRPACVSLVLVPVLRPLVVCTLPSACPVFPASRPGSRALISRDQVLVSINIPLSPSPLLLAGAQNFGLLLIHIYHTSLSPGIRRPWCSLLPPYFPSNLRSSAVLDTASLGARRPCSCFPPSLGLCRLIPIAYYLVSVTCNLAIYKPLYC